ncbi:vitelline membrane outer layer protein 1-like [Dreissena polymorpha]|uniref:Vitelline membrane outer layer protein 1 homolog n=1 Tax=Dreissena polymorpha TaxID=45954 RepID=A0A9D4IP32_DREPO|nr:vitelline membrane outer layer protein 1-like [Dreissena polymorpha]KAH3782871.1 hypothetical protein DPMN_160792 [Dreissena polymorpha]
MSRQQATLCLMLVRASAFLLQSAQRNVVEVLETRNGVAFGTWSAPQFCPSSFYAVGYKLKTEGEQQRGDDTALNGVMLLCENLDGVSGGEITSGVGLWGTWFPWTRCRRDVKNYLEVMVQFNFRAEQDQGGGDDTAGNDIQFRCNFFETRTTGEILIAQGGMPWGNWEWSNQCPPNSAICGIQTKIESSQGGGDDTSLADIKMFCCYD